jgi:hypothetical protein
VPRCYLNNSPYVTNINNYLNINGIIFIFPEIRLLTLLFFISSLEEEDVEIEPKSDEKPSILSVIIKVNQLGLVHK